MPDQHHTNTTRQLRTHLHPDGTITITTTTTNPYYANALLHWLQADQHTITQTTGIEPPHA